VESRISKMEYKKIIIESWKYTQGSKKLIFWFGFMPAIITTTVGVAYIAYQILSFKKSYLFNEIDESFFNEVIGFIWHFLQENVSWTLPMIVFGIFFILFYIFVPTIMKASAIQVIARNRSGQKCTLSKGLSYGILSFFKLFEYGALVKTFSFFSIFSEMSFVIRNLGTDLFFLFFPIFIIFMILSLLLTLLFTYSVLYIIIDKKGVFESMKKSARLVIMHWKHTFLISILMILIGVRIIIQVFLVFLIPFLIIIISGYIATIALPITGLIVGAIVGGICLLIAAYLNGVVDVFSYSVWTFTFIELTSEKELEAREVEGEAIKDEQLNEENSSES
jgi:hypothetical protein